MIKEVRVNRDAFYERHATSLQEFFADEGNLSEFLETGSVMYKSLGRSYILSMIVEEEVPV